MESRDLFITEMSLMDKAIQDEFDEADLLRTFKDPMWLLVFVVIVVIVWWNGPKGRLR